MRLRAQGASPAAQVLGLAKAKAYKIAGNVNVPQTVHYVNMGPEPEADSESDEFAEPPFVDGMSILVVACDSMLEFDGQVLGKPHSPELARERVRALSGGTGVLHTGHYVIRLDAMDVGPELSSVYVGSLGAERNYMLNYSSSRVSFGGTEAGVTESTVVHFEEFSDAEAAAYVDTGEPLEVAGSFTIDGLGGAFIRGIEGDPHNVVGISLPCLRRLLGELGVFWPDLWG